jgi:hypothetical protein
LSNGIDDERIKNYKCPFHFSYQWAVASCQFAVISLNLGGCKFAVMLFFNANCQLKTANLFSVKYQI